MSHPRDQAALERGRRMMFLLGVLVVGVGAAFGRGAARPNLALSIVATAVACPNAIFGAGVNRCYNVNGTGTAWSATAPMGVERYHHTATLMDDNTRASLTTGNFAADLASLLLRHKPGKASVLPLSRRLLM